MVVHCFTSITNNYFPKARILAKTLKCHHPDWRFYVILSEPLSESIQLENEPFDEIVNIRELNIPELYCWLFQHKVVEVCTAVKGHATSFLFENRNAQKVIYFDPDIAIFNNLQSISDLLDKHPIVLTPHQNSPDEAIQDIINNEIGSLRWGVFNLGFFAVAAKDQGIDFIDWWKKRLLLFCRDDISYGLFTDQRWCDLAPVYFDQLYILRNPEFNLATWNLTHRSVEMDKEGTILVDRKPLRFYHFSGYDSGAGFNMVEYTTSRGNNLVVREIWEWYSRELTENGQTELGNLNWYYGRFDNGEPITDEMRTIYRERQDLQKAFPNPFSSMNSAGGFHDWWVNQYNSESLVQNQNNLFEYNCLQESRASVYAQLLDNQTNDSPKEYIPISSFTLDGTKSIIKLVSFYLPQFHPIPENDLWWGKGFTEWTNVTRAIPQFPDHYQPHLPGELGFYDLRLPDIQKRQIEMARNYGIFGFGFYYYWFAGKRLLERPVDQFLACSDMDFPFCLVWANENWTRRWDGREQDILVKQVHCPQTDIQFIQNIEPFLRDKRYIRIGDRPILIVYRVDLMPNAAATVDRWREYCFKRDLGNPYLMAAQTFGFEDPRPTGFDSAIQFPPHNQHYNPLFRINDSIRFSNPNYDSFVFSYPELIKYKMDNPENAPYTLFKTVFPSWDNEPRKPGKGTIFHLSTPALYQKWLEIVCRWTFQNHLPEERFVFINAWNEWGEGAHLEPDRRYGYAYLQATMDALRSIQ
jgi:hypothetical protein